MFADKELGLGLVPQNVYDIQSKFYPTIKQTYGIPLDSRNTKNAKADWEIFTAAISSDDTRKQIIESMGNWVHDTPTNRAFTDLYDATTGE